MRQFEAVVKELSGELKSAKAERRKEVAVNSDSKYHAVERLVSMSILYYKVALSPGCSHIFVLHTEKLKMWEHLGMWLSTGQYLICSIYMYMYNVA